MPISKYALLKTGFYTSFVFFTGFFASIISDAVGINKSKEFCDDHSVICDAHKGGDLIKSIDPSVYMTSIGTYAGVAVIASFAYLGYKIVTHYKNNTSPQLPEANEEQALLASSKSSLFCSDRFDCFGSRPEATFYGGALALLLSFVFILNYILTDEIDSAFSSESFNNLNSTQKDILNDAQEDVARAMTNASFPITVACCLVHLLVCTPAAMIANRIEEKQAASTFSTL